VSATAPAARRPRPAAGLLEKPLVVVTGKGGVGKSTVAAALGLAAARRGKRTIIAEVARRELGGAPLIKALDWPGRPPADAET